jgi:hypothetical protein
VQDQPGPTLGVLAMTGVPGGQPVQFTEAHLSTGPTNAPPGAVQKGSTVLVQTGDDRLQNAIWQNGVLWSAGNASCVPSGDTALRACLHLAQVSTGGPAPAVTQWFDVGLRQSYLYFPSVAVDAQGDLFCLYNPSSATSFIGLSAAAQSTGDPPGGLGSPTTLFTSTGPYAGSWGHYSGAATDPDGTHVWLSGAHVSGPARWQGRAFQIVHAPVPSHMLIGGER